MIGRALRRVEGIERTLNRYLPEPTHQALVQEPEWSFADWLQDQVVTIDEASRSVKPWPKSDYLRDAANLLERERKIVFPKSRRMMISWLVAAYGVFTARRNPYAAVMLQADTEEKAAFMVDKRCVFIEEHLRNPAYRRPIRKVRTSAGLVGRINYQNGAFVWAIPQGDAKIRSYTPTVLILDEVDFQPQAEATVTAALALAEEDPQKSPQLVFVSTSNGSMGPVARVCASVGFVRWDGVAWEDGHVRTLRSPGGWCVVPVHYTHDQAKRSDEWRAAERQKYADLGKSEADWRREMEMDFTEQAGAPLYHAFAFGDNVIDATGVYDPHAPLVLTVDWNVDPMVWVVGQVVQGRAVVLGEVVEGPTSIRSLANEFMRQWPNHQGELWIYGDATGGARSVQTERSNVDLLMLELQRYPASRIVVRIPAANPAERDRVNAVNLALRPPRDGGPPRLQIDRSCEWLIRDLQMVEDAGNGTAVKIRDSKNPKSKLTHASDALGYWIHAEWPVGALAREGRRGRGRRRPTRRGMLGGV